MTELYANCPYTEAQFAAPQAMHEGGHLRAPAGIDELLFAMRALGCLMARCAVRHASRGERCMVKTTMNYIHANGLKFAYLEQGEGQLVILLHGFPDTAHTWSHQMPALAAAGYRVVAPFLRGYPPTDIPQNGYYDKASLASDVVALIAALGGGRPVHLVGQDWGAIT